MKLYCTPAGTWCGTEKDWKAAMKAEGADTKDARKVIEVPTSKPELLEFLTFHNVNVINPRAPRGVDVPADAPASPAPASAGTFSQTTVPSIPRQLLDLDALFGAASVAHQLGLAVQAIDNAAARIG